MKDSTKRRSVLARTLVLAGSLFGGLMKSTTGEKFKPSYAGATLRGAAPIYMPKRKKFRGYMRSEEWKRKHPR